MGEINSTEQPEPADLLAAARAAAVGALQYPRPQRGIVREIGRTLLLGLATLWIVTLVTFAMTNLQGANVAKLALGKLATPEQVAIFRHQQGLDKPALERYFAWLGNAVRGDWGVSLTLHDSTTSLIVPRVERSLLLGTVALLLALPFAFTVGLIAARRPGEIADNLLSTATLFILGLPEFVVGLVLLYFLSAQLRWLPPDSGALLYGSRTAQLKAYVLPVMTLTLIAMPYMARMVRTNVREVLATPYVQAAVMRGIHGWRLFSRHVLPNAIGPTINVIAISLAGIFTGDVIVENVFAFPGFGQEAVTAVSTSDVPVVQVIVLLAAVGFITLNFLADSLVVLLNPRLRRRQR